MKRFQVLLPALLAVIACELGLVAIKLPTPAVRAASPGVTYTPEDPHDTRKRQLTAVQQEIARLDARVHDNSRRLLATCIYADSAWHFGNATFGVDPGNIPENYAPVETYKSGCSAQGWNRQRWGTLDTPFGP